MTDQLDIAGGAGGMNARLTDLRAESRAIHDAGTDLLGRVGAVSRAAVDDDVLAAALICPDEVPGVEAAVVMAATGPHGLAARGAALVTTSTLVEAAATTYEAVDEARARALDAAQFGAGYMVGRALPGIALLGGGLLVANPLLAVPLVTYGLSGDPLDDLQNTLYDNPWMLEGLTRTAPGLVEGTGVTLSGLLGPAGPPLLSTLTGGHWPSADYEDAVAGLVALGGLGGAFEDEGSFELGQGVVRTDVSWSPDYAVRDVFRGHADMDLDQPADTRDALGQLQIVAVPQADGTAAYVVQIPGTEDWSPTRSDNPLDLTTNVRLMTGQDSAWRRTVIQAIRDQVPPGSPVMLTGHSQGGITAASIASDPEVVRELSIRSVVTGGSPIGRFDIDPSVSVLSLEHEQDPVPMLDGVPNPDRSSWTTVRRDLPDELATTDGVTSPGTAHSGDNYASTGIAVDESTDPGIARWRAENARFFTGSGAPVVTRYDVEPTS